MPRNAALQLCLAPVDERGDLLGIQDGVRIREKKRRVVLFTAIDDLQHVSSAALIQLHIMPRTTIAPVIHWAAGENRNTGSIGDVVCARYQHGAPPTSSDKTHPWYPCVEGEPASTGSYLWVSSAARPPCSR